MATFDSSSMYEHTMAQDAFVVLGNLCRTCAAFCGQSNLLHRVFKGDDLRIGTTESFKICSAEQLKAGYLGGCHLCALIWYRAEGRLLDPSRPSITTDAEVIINLRASNFEKEYEMSKETNAIRKGLWKLVPPMIGSLGVIEMRIPAVHRYLDSSNVQGVSAWPRLFIYLSNNPKLNTVALRPVREPVSSRHDAKLQQIAEWHQSCARSHNKCSKFSNFIAPEADHPSRLLDLYGSRIRLEIDVGAITQLRYATLSHMWGPNPSSLLQLEQASVDTFKSEIRHEQLPAKYIEAIRVTKALGIRYLWIDSLCIIQDSEEDWKREALKMATVYGRSACNISYPHPPSDTVYKHLRDPRISLPCKLHPQPGLRQGSDAIRARIRLRKRSQPDYLVVQHVAGKLSHFWSPSTHRHVWPLLSRAWVFQERLLCSRNIYYGDERLLWECCEEVIDEFCGPLPYCPRSKSQFYPVLAGLDGDTRLAHGQVLTLKNQWPLMVQEYRAGALTYEKDRAIAFAGVAKAIQSQTGFKYMAGIWDGFVELGLLWCVGGMSDAGQFREKRDQQSRVAPSWSWFSIPCDLSTSGNDTIDFRIYDTLAIGAHTVYKAELLRFGRWTPREPAPDTVFHDFTDQYITMRSHRIPCTLEWDENVIRVLPRGRLWLPVGNWREPKYAMRYVHDEVDLFPGCQLPTEACMKLTLVEAWKSFGKKDRTYGDETMEKMGHTAAHTYWQYAGLVVVPARRIIQGREAWRRIGAFLFSDNVEGAWTFSTPFDIGTSAEEETTLV